MKFECMGILQANPVFVSYRLFMHGMVIFGCGCCIAFYIVIIIQAVQAN